MSSPEVRARFDELLSRYLDASMGDAEEHELLQLLSDEALAARFYEATKLNTEIAGILAGSVPDEIMVRLVRSQVAPRSAAATGGQPRPRKSSPQIGANAAPMVERRSLAWLALGASIAVLLAFSAYYFRPAPLGPAAVRVPLSHRTSRAAISSVQGEVYLTGGAARVSLAAGQALRSGGTIETVGPDSRVAITLADKTEIELKGDTTFTVDLDPAKRRLFLKRGMLVASVAKQPAGAPMIFTSDSAKAIVRGTRLALIQDDSSTYLIVLEGKVALQRAGGGPEVLVGDGFYAHVEWEGEFHPFPIDRLPRSILEQLPRD